MIAMSRRPLAAAALVVIALTACAGHRRYERPPVSLPAAWEATGGVTATAQDEERWWARFGDRALDALVEDAARHNADLALAALKVRRARLEAGLAAGTQLPSVSVGATTGLSRSVTSGARATSSFGLSGTASWEVDLWGRLASQRSAAQWEATATEQDRQGAALTLTGTTATLYWTIGHLKQRLALSEQSIAYARKALDLARALQEAGSGSGLDVAQAEQSTASQEAAHTQLEQQLVEARHALALLFDGGLTEGRAEPGRLPDSPLPEVEAGLPAELLSRRPDLRAAELRLRATYATADATRASWYPTLTLTGALGTTSDALSRLLQNPVATLGAGLLLPFVQWRDMQRKVEISQVEVEAATISFRQTLYQAFVEAENALSARTQYRLQAEKLAQSLAAARRAESLSEIRYRAGAVSLKVWLDAQEARRQTEAAVAENRLNQLLTHVALIEAIGGDAAPL
jgi:NodT family efflux transporter outer membrane factor (OMF) lipoprotein